MSRIWLFRPVAAAAVAWSTMWLTAVALAQETPTQDAEAVAPAESPEAPRPGRYWLGLVCVEQEPGKQPVGLRVNDVAPGGPADSAGIHPGDVLTKAGDQTLAKIQDLAALINASEGKALHLTISRPGNGEESTEMAIDVQPSERPGPRGPRDWRDMVRDLAREAMEGDPGRLMEALEGVAPQFTGEVRRRLGPGVVVAEPMPDDMTVTITRQGRQPAQVKVTQGDQTWEAQEDQIDKLPDNVRPHVEHMLGRDVMVRVFRPGQPPMPLAPSAPRARLEQAEEEIREKIQENVREKRQEVERAQDDARRRRDEVREEVRRRVDRGRDDLEVRVEDLLKQLEAKQHELEGLLGSQSDRLEQKGKELESLLNDKLQQLEKLLEKVPSEKPAAEAPDKI
jgi:DNA repair exonuclease SbcCD ATPase subunit